MRIIEIKVNAFTVLYEKENEVFVSDVFSVRK